MEGTGSFSRVLLQHRGRVSSSPALRPDVTPLKSKQNTESPKSQSPATKEAESGTSFYEQLRALQKPNRPAPNSKKAPIENTKRQDAVANGKSPEGNIVLMQISVSFSCLTFL